MIARLHDLHDPLEFTGINTTYQFHDHKFFCLLISETRYRDLNC
jgi:hypothetical protein